jgi:uncharacterized OB-fold protein
VLRAHLFPKVGGATASDSLPSASHTVDDYVKGYEEGGRLRGFRCPSCGLVTATWGLACARCGHRPLEEFELAPHGKVVAFTILNVPGDEFLNDAPYAYVVVELDGGGRVTGWMPSVRAEHEIEIGDRVRYVSSYKPGVQFVKDTGGPRSG